MFNTLSGRFLVLTIAFVMLAEVLIFVPSIAGFREDYLRARLERAQIASLALLADDILDPALEQELLQTAGIYNVVLLRDEARELVLSSPVPSPVQATFDLRAPSQAALIRDALARLLDPDDAVIRVIGAPVGMGGLQIEVTLPAQPLHAAMVDFSRNILWVSLVISGITAGLLFLVVRVMFVRPVRAVVSSMQSWAKAPEDARRVLDPSSKLSELREAEVALHDMQTELAQALKQKERLARLGGAVARISHDLRNILTTAQLFADRVEMSADPGVQRTVPKLIGSIDRAVNLTEATLSFGRAEDPAPRLARVPLAGIVEDVLESERLACGDCGIVFTAEIPPGLTLRADAEQLHRILSNLVRNARQAIEATGCAGEIAVTAAEDEAEWSIAVRDTGPGLPAKARETLFQPFSAGTRKGGTGLGLAIAADLARGHGGRLELVSTGPAGTRFAVHLPRGLETAAS